MKKGLFILIFLVTAQWCQAQTQEDFTALYTSIFLNLEDKNEARRLADKLLKMVNDHQDLQTSTNYFILASIFENQVYDENKAVECKKKAHALVYNTPNTGAVGNDAQSVWHNQYYPHLFKRNKPKIAREAFDFLKEHPSLQNFQNYSAVAYSFEGINNFQKAEELYESAMSLVKNDRQEYHSYSNYIHFLARSGKYLRAEELIKHVEDLSKNASDLLRTSYKAELLSSRFIYYLFSGDYFRYQKAANEMYDYYETLPNQTECPTYALPRITTDAHCAEILGEYKQAYEKWKKRDEIELEWVNCFNESYPHMKQKSISMFPVYQIKIGKSHEVDRSFHALIKQTNAYYAAGEDYYNTEVFLYKAIHLAFLNAPEYAEQFELIMEKVENSKDFTTSTLPFSHYAYFSTRDRKLSKSIDTYKKLFELNVRWINDIVFSFSEKAFVSYFNDRLKAGYDNFHSFVKLTQQSNTKLHHRAAEMAYDNTLLTKSIAFKASQKRKKAFLKNNSPRIIHIYNQWISKKRKLIRLYQTRQDPKSIGQAPKSAINLDSVEILQQEVDQLESRLASESRDFDKLLKIKAPKWQDVQKQLKQGEAAVEIVRFNWRDQVYYSDTAYYAAYIVTADSPNPEVVYLSTLAKELDDKYYNLYKNSVTLKIEDKTSYNRYWKEIKNKLGNVRRVYFSADGIYHLINMSTLKNPENGNFLLEETEIKNVTSTQFFRNSEDVTTIKNAVLIGRPSYNLSQSIMDKSEAVATRSFVTNFRDADITDLPGTEVEVNTIAESFKTSAIDVKSYLGNGAKEEVLYRLKNPDILHIATHGYWSKIDYSTTSGYRTFNAMVNSGLLMAGVINYYSADQLANTHDGILTAYEAQNLLLDDTKLVVLSACETGLGHFDAGEGVYGLQRAFRAAGAKSIITSLWKVDDTATRDFMISFYKQLLQTGKKFESFKAAQLEMKEKYKDAYYWGAFVLLGN